MFQCGHLGIMNGLSWALECLLNKMLIAVKQEYSKYKIYITHYVWSILFLKKLACMHSVCSALGMVTVNFNSNFFWQKNYLECTKQAHSLILRNGEIQYYLFCWHENPNGHNQALFFQFQFIDFVITSKFHQTFNNKTIM